MKSAPESVELQVLGAPTLAWRYGNPGGALIVLVHGFRGDHHGLEGIALDLTARDHDLCVIVPDLPGFGASQAIEGREHNLALYGEWLCTLVEQLRAERASEESFAILGHSFGSLVVANAMSKDLDPAAAVLINPISAPALEGPQAVMTRLARSYYRAAEALPERAARALLGSPLIVRVMSEFMAKTNERDLRAWIHDQHDRYFSDFADPHTLLEAFHASVSHTVTEYADSFQSPTLIIAGDLDDITPLSAQLALAHRIPKARFRVVPGAGHLVHYEAVEYAAAEVLEFFRKYAGSGI